MQLTTTTATRTAPPIAALDRLALEEALNADVLHQAEGIAAVAALASQAWRHHRELEYAPPDRPCVLSALLAGPSGCGKTETAQRLRHYLGMARGQACERHYVFFDASTCKDKTSATRITGTGAGYLGYGDGQTLADLLCAALTPPPVPFPPALHELDARTKAYKHAYKAHKHAVKQAALNASAPPVLLLFVDEIDKAHDDFLLSLNGLLTTGALKAPTGREFVLPRATCLLVLFTANYADRAIAALTERDTQLAVQLVEQDVIKRGLQKCTLERFGKIVAYFALDKRQLAAVLHAKLDAYVARDNKISARYGPVEYPAEVRDFLVEHVLTQADAERGVRNGLRLLFDNLQNLFDLALCVIERDPQRWRGHFRVFSRRCRVSDAQELCSTPLNSKEVALHRAHGALHVKALGVQRDAELVALQVLPLVRAVGHYCDDVQRRMQQLRSENDALQQQLAQVYALWDEPDDAVLRRRLRAMQQHHDMAPPRVAPVQEAARLAQLVQQEMQAPQARQADGVLAQMALPQQQRLARMVEAAEKRHIALDWPEPQKRARLRGKSLSDVVAHVHVID